MFATPLRQSALVAAVAAFVMLTNLGGARLWDRDEPRNATCAREMLTRLDLVVPTFNGELRTHKPVLLYWCIMAAYSVLGVNELAARLPSALAAIGTAICVYQMGRRLFGFTAGIWAGVALATSLMFVVAGRAATPDSLLIFCSTLALTIFVCGSVSNSSITSHFPTHWPTVLAMYAAMGLGVLAKGPVGFILPTAVIGMFLLIVRLPPPDEQFTTIWSIFRRAIAPFDPLHFLATCWSMRPFTALFAVFAVALPWYWAVGLATDGEFLKGFFLDHNLGRATATMEHHSGSVLYYPVAILVGFFPWSVFALPLIIDTVVQSNRNEQTRKAYLFLACWIGVYVVLFSLARTKLPSYVTPCYPALALLVGQYIDRWSRNRDAIAGRWLLAAFSVLAIAGVAITNLVPLAMKDVLAGEERLAFFGLIPVAGGLLCCGLAAIKDYRAAAAAFGVTAVAFVTVLFAIGTERISHHQTSDRLFQAARAQSALARIASYKVLEPSWVFYGGHHIQEFGATQAGHDTNPMSQASHFLLYEDSFLITTDDRLPELAPALPPGVGVVAGTPYFLKAGRRLLLIGRQSPAEQALTSRPAKTLDTVTN